MLERCPALVVGGEWKEAHRRQTKRHHWHHHRSRSRCTMAKVCQRLDAEWVARRMSMRTQRWWERGHVGLLPWKETAHDPRWWQTQRLHVALHHLKLLQVLRARWSWSSDWRTQLRQDLLQLQSSEAWRGSLVAWREEGRSWRHPGQSRGNSLRPWRTWLLSLSSWCWTT